MGREGEVIDIRGARLVPDVSGGLWWPETETLVVADLHLEKGSAFAARGAMLPPYDTAATLARLEETAARRGPRRIIALGDSFHDSGAGGRLADCDRDRLVRLQSRCDWLWIAGNHDPAPPEGIGGAWHEEVTIGPLTFRHAPETGGGTGEIAGHLHPVARVRLKGRALRRRCLVCDGFRAILPAFGAFTGGLNVLDAAYEGLFAGRGFTAWLLGARSVYPLPGHLLVG